MIILIDDDRLVYLGWKLKADKLGLHLIHYFSVDDFLSKSNDLEKSTKIYVDSDLGENLRGEIEAQKIYQIGFHNIFLVTGYNKSDYDLTKFTWIKDILNKTPPF